MDIQSKELSTLLAEIEKVRRRKIADYTNGEAIDYVDPEGHLEKLSINNNHLIFGRRGSGKTTLILAVIKQNSSDIITPIDIQPIKNDNYNVIILKILIDTLNDLSRGYQPEFLKLEGKYKLQYKGLHGIKALLLRRRDQELKSTYFTRKTFLSLLNKELTFLEMLKSLPEEVTCKVTQENKYAKEEIQKTSQKTFNSANVNIEAGLQGKYKNFTTKIDFMASAVTECTSEYSSETNRKCATAIKTDYERTYTKSEMVREQIDCIAFLFNEFRHISGHLVAIYLDDFYQIPIDRQPKIIQYFHDIYKCCYNSSFAFNLSALPYRIRLNEPQNVDLSYKDDFSPIKLDNDLSALNTTKEYLLNILVHLNCALAITKQDINSLFNNDEVLMYSIIATGGVPRDFILMFADLIRTARTDNRTTIQKEHIYTVVKNSREDKDNNIEYDADIAPDLIRKAIEVLKQDVVIGLNTNVILYPKVLADKHEFLLKNLSNLRYLHIIKDSVTSETRKKEEFVAYLVDMSFYAVNKRLRPGFDFRRFWETDDGARLTQLRQSKIWGFPDELFG